MEETETFELPREFAEKWIEALRSGKYNQGKGYLHNDGGYCCLGVACRIFGTSKNNLEGKTYIFKQKKFDSHLMLPKTNQIPDLLKGDLNESDFVSKVSEMNDRGLTFNQIADWVEENVKFI
ncbi:MAG: hypothetical protein AAF600_13130 [Bacteroidota bacterium]